jgi:uncharacterized protein DUF6880
MASKKTLNLDNLAALGPERLAAILIDVAAGNADIKRRLRLELAAQAGGGDALAAEVGKRLTALRAARSFVDWQKRREFLKDLDQQRVMIVDRIAQTRPDLALDLMWRFMDLAEPVFNRVDDSNGSVGDVFHKACDNLATIAVMARPDPGRGLRPSRWCKLGDGHQHRRSGRGQRGKGRFITGGHTGHRFQRQVTVL